MYEFLGMHRVAWLSNVYCMKGSFIEFLLNECDPDTTGMRLLVVEMVKGVIHRLDDTQTVQGGCTFRELSYSLSLRRQRRDSQIASESGPSSQ